VIIGKITFEFPIRARASLLVGVALLIAACSRPGSTAGSSALKPIDKAALETMVDTTAKELLIPGAVVLLRTPQGDFTITYGTTLLGAASPPRADTYFRIASNTKTMTAAVIMQLAQESKLSLDDPVSKYVTGVPNGDNITIAELLEMRSGLYNYTNDPVISATIDTDPAKVWTPAELLAIAFAHHPISRRVQSTSTSTPTMRFSVSSLKKSTASRWRRRCRIDCSARWDCNTPCFPPAP